MCLISFFRFFTRNRSNKTSDPTEQFMTQFERDLELAKKKYPGLAEYLKTPEGRRQLSEAKHNPIHDQDTMANAEARYYEKRNNYPDSDGGFDPGVG